MPSETSCTPRFILAALLLLLLFWGASPPVLLAQSDGEESFQDLNRASSEPEHRAPAGSAPPQEFGNSAVQRTGEADSGDVVHKVRPGEYVSLIVKKYYRGFETDLGPIVTEVIRLNGLEKYPDRSEFQVP